MLPGERPASARVEFQASPDGRYRYCVPDGRIELIADHLRRERHDLHGELEVRCLLAGAQTFNNGVVSVGNFNFSSPRARQERARLVATAARTRATDVDWSAHFEDFSQRILAAERNGCASVPLHTIPRQAADATLEVHGLSILRDQPQIVFAPGGAGKSLFGLAVIGELGRRGIRTLLADWELDGGAHRVRFDALGLPPTIHYRRCDQPLSVLADSIRRDMLEHDLRFLLIDSVAPACLGRPEDAEAAIDFFKAWRRIGMGGLAVAHTRAEDGEQRPFGSIFWHNLARSTFFLNRVGDPTQSKTITLGVFHRKSNLGPLLPPFGLELTLTTASDGSLSSVTLQQIDITEVGELAESLPLWQRMRRALRVHPMTIAELAEQLVAKPDSIEKAATRRPKVFAKVTRTPDGIHRLALVERRGA